MLLLEKHNFLYIYMHESDFLQRLKQEFID